MSLRTLFASDIFQVSTSQSWGPSFEARSARRQAASEPHTNTKFVSQNREMGYNAYHEKGLLITNHNDIIMT